MSEDDYTPPGTSRRQAADYRGDLLTGTAAPLRQAAARMNVAAVSLVHAGVLLFALVGFGTTIWSLGDSFWHHVLGIWPVGHEAAENGRLRQELAEVKAENTRLREALIDRASQAEEAR